MNAEGGRSLPCVYLWSVAEAADSRFVGWLDGLSSLVKTYVLVLGTTTDYRVGDRTGRPASA